MPKFQNKAVTVVSDDGDRVRIRHDDGREETVNRTQLTEMPPKSQGKPPDHSSAGGNPPDHAQKPDSPPGQDNKPHVEPR